LMGYGHKEIWAQIPSDPPVNAELLKKMGFTVDEEGVPGQSNTMIKGPLKSLKLEGFASSREAEDRISGVEIAGAMTNMLQIAMQNPVASMAIGADQFIKIVNEISKVAGLPRDFKLVVKNRDKINEIEGGQPSQADQMMQAMQQQMQEVIAQLGEEILNKSGEQSMAVVQEAVGPIAEVVQQNSEQIKQTQEAIPPLAESIDQIGARLAQLMQLASQANGRAANTPQQPQ
jgi:methyl-accepting chemotaxis protein